MSLDGFTYVILVSVLTSLITNFTIVKLYTIYSMKKFQELCTDTINQMEQISTDYMKQVKETNDDTIGKLSKS